MTETVQVYRFPLLIKKGIYTRKILCLLLFTWGVNTLCNSQTTNFLPFTKLEIKDGLPGINIRKITQDKFGFMWFATQDGISRFDGKSFISLNSYDIDDRRRIIGTDAYDIKNDKTGNFLWALTAYGGLNKIDVTTCNVVNAYKVKSQKQTDATLWYKCFQETNNTIIIGTYEGLIHIFDKKSGKITSTINLQEKFNCNGALEDIMIDGQDRVWFFISKTGILVTDLTCSQKITLIPAADFRRKELVFSNYAVYQNKVLLATSGGLFTINISNLSLENPLSGIPGYTNDLSQVELNSIAVYGSEALICGTNILKKLNLKTGHTENLQLAGNIDDRSWAGLSNTIFFTGKSVWIGSPKGIAWIRNINSPFSSYFNSFDGKNIKINHAITICKTSSSNVLVCAYDGLFLVNHANAHIKKLLGDGAYYSAFPIAKGFYIASAESKGLKMFDSNFNRVNIVSVFPELKRIEKDLLMCSARFGDSVIFMASQNNHGLYIWDVKSGKIDSINTRTKNLKLQNNNINRLFIDSQKRLWIVCENAVSIYDHNKKTILPVPLTDKITKVPLSINMDVCETNNGYWLTSYGTGIVELSKDLSLLKIYTAADGINNLGLYKIFNLNDTLLIASSNNGLVTINLKTKKIKNYFTEDGLQSNSFEEASGDTNDDYVFLGGINGITRIDRKKFIPDIQQPVLTFSTISQTSNSASTDTLNVEMNKVEIQPDISQITINFAAIDYSDPEKLRYAYRIEEKDAGWNISSKNSAQSFRLKPGKYQLHVKAINEDGVESEIKTLTLIFKPKWYQTWQFQVLVGLAIIALAYSFYRLRINQLKKEQRIRTKLASDLHDDLGSTMNSVKLFANMAIMEYPQGKYPPLIKHSAQEAITGIRDMIWVLDDRKDAAEDLLHRISQFAQPLCEATNIQYVQDIGNSVRSYKLGQEEKRNLYMMLKESVNNAIKYAESPVITITAYLQKNKPVFIISDQGKGFTVSDDSAGNGLNNLKIRAAAIHYQLGIDSTPGKGTRIRLEKD
ncbi:MAG: triple tyrosine motif-containing protein [Bacteroidetes bacterium]|nr:triple tyrosine motif-containing protein [Bacteroidota bacterium]